jgi:transcriptional regulator with AAA-type ATPase domain
MHPLIKSYIETAAPPEVVMKQFYELEPTNKMIENLYKVSMELSVPRAEPREFECDDSFLLEKTYDNDLIALYYQLNARQANKCHKYQISKLLFKRSNTYISQNTPPHINLITKSGLLNGTKQFEFIEKDLAKNAETSPRYANTFGMYYQRLACVGRFSQAKLVDFYHNNNLFKPDFNRMALVNFANAIETFQVDKIEEFKTKIFSEDLEKDPIPSLHESILWIYKLLYQVLFERDKWPALHFDKNKNILAMYYLLNRQNEKALQIAKEFYSLDVSLMINYTLLRCELVNRNFESAYQNIRAFLVANGEDYLLNFFYARIEIALGNKIEAAKHFNHALALARKFQAEELLNFEISLSYELSISDLRFLLQNNEKSDAIIEPLHISLPIANAPQFGTLKGSSSNALEIKINTYANSNLPVLITGETGVGKDYVAKMLHEQGDRKHLEYYAINCGAISESLLQSELFGHVAGSFTGAHKTHKGVFEAVGKGTILLDEIGEITPALQVALLRVLDQNEFKPVGSSISKKCQCRILFSTNANLEKLVEENKFRKDLLFRLKRLEINIPPLRERAQEIPNLILHFLSIGRRDAKIPVVSNDLMNAFRNYSWPGNIRQLKNEMEKLRVLHSEKLTYFLDDFPFKDQPPERKRKERTTAIFKAAVVNNTTITSVLNKSNHSIRRLGKMRDLFNSHKIFTRKELIEITKGSPKTVSSDLDQLCDEGHIVRKQPTPAPRTHYFELKI